jgi:hypothetical protein
LDNVKEYAMYIDPKLPITVSQLNEYFEVARDVYKPKHRKMIVLDAVDNSNLWKAIGAKFPKYQILPDTNMVSYVKQNLVSSIYTVTKSASLLPTSEKDRDAIENINIALDYIWDMCDIGYKQLQAGDNAALFNIGVTQVGWDPNAKAGDSNKPGQIVVKNISPLHYMRDPFAESLDTAAYCIIWDEYHKSVLLADNRYKDKFKTYLDSISVASLLDDVPQKLNDPDTSYTPQNYYRVFTYFVKYTNDDGEQKIAEIHLLENRHVLFYKTEIKPNKFPIVELYCNLPKSDVIGTSEPAKILSNNIAYNILNSIMLTSEYKNQRPPKFINSQAGLNVKTFAKYGSDADHTFLVNGDASRAVHYHQFPQASGMAPVLQNSLLTDIQTVTGIDARYTGRDTGSVLTTGGIEDMLTRVTLIDTPKILNYEHYTKKLTQLILENFAEYSMKREYIHKDKTTGEYKKITVDYSSLKNTAITQYAINISSELPKNKQRVAAMANMLMEKQMQYGSSENRPDIIQPEEWLEMQDLPNKEYMLKRMNIERLSTKTAEVADTLFSFAGLVKGGYSPEDAITAVAQNATARARGEEPPVEIPTDDELAAMDMANSLENTEVPYTEETMPMQTIPNTPLEQEQTLDPETLQAVLAGIDEQNNPMY